MFVIAGATGHVGSAAAEALLGKGSAIRVIVRDPAKSAAWSARGVDVAIGRLEDEAFLTSAFRGAAGAFVLLPPNYASVNILEDQRELGATIARAVKAAGVPHVVALSSIGADVPEGTGPIKGLYHFENALRASGTQVTAIRAGYFMENIAQAIGAATTAGIYPNLLPSQDLASPMVATRDIGQLVAESLIAGPRTEAIDLTGPGYSARQLAEKLSRALNRPLKIIDIPQAGWFDALVGAGVPKPWAEQYVEMYTGMQSGKVAPRGDRTVTGKTGIDAVIATLLGQNVKAT